MFAAATPVSVRIKLFMATPDTLRKCKVPNPADGTVKVKVSPTETQLLAGQPTGSRIIMRGSMLSAELFLLRGTPVSPNCNLLHLAVSTKPGEGFAPWALLHYPASDTCD